MTCLRIGRCTNFGLYILFFRAALMNKSKSSFVQYTGRVKSMDWDAITVCASKTTLSGEVFKESFTDVLQTDLDQVAFSLGSAKERDRDNPRNLPCIKNDMQTGLYATLFPSRASLFFFKQKKRKPEQSFVRSFAPVNTSRHKLWWQSQCKASLAKHLQASPQKAKQGCAKQRVCLARVAFRRTCRQSSAQGLFSEKYSSKALNKPLLHKAFLSKQLSKRSFVGLPCSCLQLFLQSKNSCRQRHRYDKTKGPEKKPSSKATSSISLFVKIGDYLSSGDRIGRRKLHKKEISLIPGLKTASPARSLLRYPLNALGRGRFVFAAQEDGFGAKEQTATDLITNLGDNNYYKAMLCLAGLRFEQLSKKFFQKHPRFEQRAVLQLQAQSNALQDGASCTCNAQNVSTALHSFASLFFFFSRFLREKKREKKKKRFVRNLSRAVLQRHAPFGNGKEKLGQKIIDSQNRRNIPLLYSLKKQRSSSPYTQRGLDGFYPCSCLTCKAVQGSQRSALYALENKAVFCNRFAPQKLGTHAKASRARKEKTRSLKNTERPIILNQSGRVVTISKTQLSIQKTQPILFYSSANLHVKRGNWVKEGSPIVTLTHQTLITGDIVQGIPRIEQLFEAFTSPPPAFKDKRGVARLKDVHDTLHSQLREIFRKHWLKNVLPIAVRKSLEDIGYTLLEMIQKVYLSQGVLIADKHIEIVVRQIASKGQVLDSGTTGLFLEETLPIRQIENANLATPGKKCLYVPAVMGLTASALNSDSFISAASFQETTRVLSRDAVVGKSDFLRGLKEKVVIGDLISAGTGLDIYFIYTTMLAR